jgi:hypothetical protein
MLLRLTCWEVHKSLLVLESEKMSRMCHSTIIKDLTFRLLAWTFIKETLHIKITHVGLSVGSNAGNKDKEVEQHSRKTSRIKETNLFLVFGFMQEEQTSSCTKKCGNLREQYREKKKHTTENRTTFQKTN